MSIDTALRFTHTALAESFKPDSDVFTIQDCLREAIINLLEDCSEEVRQYHLAGYQSLMKSLIDESA